MSKRRFRVEPYRYGGEVVVGRVSWDFVQAMEGLDSQEIWEAIWAWENAGSVEEFTEETGYPPVLDDEEPGKSWHEYDDFEHLSGGFSDCEWQVTEVPADGSDDLGYGISDSVTHEDVPYQVISREAYFNSEEPQEDPEDWIPVVSVFSSEKGGMGAWMVETDGEDFDFRKLGYSLLETNLCELIEEVWYNGEQAEPNFDAADTVGKSIEASAGFMKESWWDSREKVYNDEYLEEYMDGYRDHLQELLDQD